MKSVLLTCVGLFAAVACQANVLGGEVDSSRIVSLSGDLTEIVYELGFGDNMVGVDVTTVGPDAALELPIVGVGRFITAEGVLGEDPTLVLGDTQSSPLSALQQIESAGVAVEIFPVATTFGELYEKIASIGRLLGAETEAEDLVRRVRSDVESALAHVERSDRRIAYIYTRGPDVILLFGDGMTTAPIFEAVGAVDAAVETGIVGSVPISAEALIAAAPDVIVVPEEGLAVLGGIDGLLEVPGVAETPAGRARAILSYPEGDFLTFGPRIGHTLELLVRDLRSLGK